MARCHESENLSRRDRKFNISALVNAAVNAVGDDAESCKVLLVLYRVKLLLRLWIMELRL